LLLGTCLAVRRNKERFPEDFMFQLTRSEADNLILQFARASLHGGRRTPPLVFTELGVAMHSSDLNSERAVQMNITIMRAFVRLRSVISHNKKIASRLEKLETASNESPPSSKFWSRTSTGSQSAWSS